MQQSRMTDARLRQCLSLLVCALILLKAEGASVGITFLQNVVAKGAGTRSIAFLFLFCILAF